ncbi:GLPGLI family protein [Aquimarina algiphila]|uniref:GLPGLI family protein n=1 Tax=Aquimarina algiphila TaxID=2047982 RepID=UPI00232C463F|nr:GLPGLI family protein [Aquimarina algiphila]
MNRRLVIFLILMQFSFVFAQDQFTGIVQYDFIVHNKNDLSFANPYELYFNTTISLYEKIDNPKKNVSKKNNNTTDSEGRMISNKKLKSNLPPPFYYSNTRNKELIFRENVISKMYFVKDALEPIPWKLQQEHKKIANYNCQKATAKYRGREYTVWFTTEIPVSHGPWKLRGLPGLILEVTEETGKYGFVANAVNLNPDKELLQKKLKKPDIEGITTMENYIEAIKNKYENTMAMARASLPRGARLATDCDVCPDPKNYSLERFD